MSFELKCELIAAIEEKECLWNPYCEDYHKGHKRNMAWANILRDLEMKGHRLHLMVAKNYWKSLRDHWKKRQYPSAEGRKPWVFSERLNFLSDCGPRTPYVRRTRSASCDPGPCSTPDVPRPSSGGGTPSHCPLYEEQVYEETYDGLSASYVVQGREEGNIRESDSGTSDSVTEEKPVFMKRSVDASPAIPGPASKRRRLEHSERGTGYVQQNPHRLREQSVSTYDRSNGLSDKFQYFGDMVSSILRDLPADVANEKMASICAILFQNGCDQGVEQAGRSSQRQRGRQQQSR